VRASRIRPYAGECFIARSMSFKVEHNPTQRARPPDQFTAHCDLSNVEARRRYFQKLWRRLRVITDSSPRLLHSRSYLRARQFFSRHARSGLQVNYCPMFSRKVERNCRPKRPGSQPKTVITVIQCSNAPAMRQLARHLSIPIPFCPFEPLAPDLTCFKYRSNVAGSRFGIVCIAERCPPQGSHEVPCHLSLFTLQC
jgi:hypothetical protein